MPLAKVTRMWLPTTGTPSPVREVSVFNDTHYKDFPAIADTYTVVISLGKYLGSGKDGRTDLKRILLLILQGVEVNAVKGDPVEYDRFRLSVRAAIAELEKELPEPEVLVLIGSLIANIKEHNDRTSALVQRLEGEHRGMALLMGETMHKIGSGSKDGGTRLDEIRRQLENASQLEDVRLIRLRLRECADAVVAEIARERTQSASLISSLEEKLATRPAGSAAPTGSVELDATTGLPGWKMADEALRGCLGRPDAYAVPVVASRVRAIGSRWGQQAAEHVLRSVSNRLCKGLAVNDRVFRGRGPSLLAIVSRPGGTDAVRRELMQLWQKPEQEVIEVGNTTVLMPIAASWSVFSLEDAEGWESKLKCFLATQGVVE